MDTLRLAINYIRFLKELIESTKLEDEQFGERKIIISCSQSQNYTRGSSMVIGHSLSWKRDDMNDGNKIKTGKIWVPQREDVIQVDS